MLSKILSRCLWPCLDCKALALHSSMSHVHRFLSHGNQGGERGMLGSEIALWHSWHTGKHSCSPSYIFRYQSSFKLLNKVSKYVKNQVLYYSWICFPISKTELIILFSYGHYNEKDINYVAEVQSHKNTHQEARDSQSMEGLYYQQEKRGQGHTSPPMNAALCSM